RGGLLPPPAPPVGEGLIVYSHIPSPYMAAQSLSPLGRSAVMWVPGEAGRGIVNDLPAIATCSPLKVAVHVPPRHAVSHNGRSDDTFSVSTGSDLQIVPSHTARAVGNSATTALSQTEMRWTS